MPRETEASSAGINGKASKRRNESGDSPSDRPLKRSRPEESGSFDERLHIFVANLPWNTSEPAVALKLFPGCSGVQFLADKKGRFKGRAIVRFAASEGAEAAMLRSGSEFEGRKITLSYAKAELIKDKDSFWTPSTTKSFPTAAPPTVGSPSASTPAAAAPDTASRCVFVSNIPWDSPDGDLREFFGSGVSGVHRLTDKRGRFKGRAVVWFGSQDLADRARAKSGSTLGGRAVSIVPARSELLPEGMRPSGAAPTAATAAAPSSPCAPAASSAPEYRAGDGGHYVFVANLAWDVTESDVRNAFPGMDGVMWIKDKRRKDRFKGRAIVRFGDTMSARGAVDRLAAEGVTIGGRTQSGAFAREELMKSGFDNESEQKVAARRPTSMPKPSIPVGPRPDGCNVVFVAGVHRDIEDSHIHTLFRYTRCRTRDVLNTFLTQTLTPPCSLRAEQ